MENVHNIKDFKKVKKVKVYVSHLKAILHIINLSIAGLKNFEVYAPVHDILKVMREQKRILDSHLKNYEEFLLKEKQKNEEEK